MLTKLLKNDFNRSVLTLVIGTSIAQAIPIIISPILTRLYSPEDLGVLSLFVAITSILGVVANARYELAIVLPEKEEDAINIAALAIIIAFVISSLLMITIIIFHEEVAKLLGNKDISFWLYFIPLVVFFTGLYNTLNYLNTRLKLFSTISKVNIYKSLTTAIVQLTCGFFYLGSSGLILGQIASNLAANGKLAKDSFSKLEFREVIDRKAILKMAKKYSDFPKYSLWAALGNSLSNQVNNVLISTFFSIGVLGQYSLVQRMLGFPSTFIGNAIGQVFFQQASAEKIKKGNASSTFNSTFKKLVLISIPSFGTLYIIIEPLTVFVFGANWALAGEIAKILIPLFCIRFIVAPLTTINSIFEKQKVSMLWQLGLLILTLLIFAISYFYSLKIKTFFCFYTIAISIYYIFLFFLLKKYSKGL